MRHFAAIQLYGTEKNNLRNPPNYCQSEYHSEETRYLRDTQPSACFRSSRFNVAGSFIAAIVRSLIRCFVSARKAHTRQIEGLWTASDRPNTMLILSPRCFLSIGSQEGPEPNPQNTPPPFQVRLDLFLRTPALLRQRRFGSSTHSPSSRASNKDRHANHKTQPHSFQVMLALPPRSFAGQILAFLFIQEQPSPPSKHSLSCPRVACPCFKHSPFAGLL